MTGGEVPASGSKPCQARGDRGDGVPRSGLCRLQREVRRGQQQDRRPRGGGWGEGERGAQGAAHH